MVKHEQNVDRFNKLTRQILDTLNESFPKSAILNTNTFNLEMGKFDGTNRLLSNDEVFLGATLDWLAGEGFIRLVSSGIYVITLKGLALLGDVPESLQRE